ncbi:hypothetical protein [Bacillus sp. FSL K6-0067]|uniref:hypothetical protein n=1 Tax=Bacillus sp. FSL K6-0067 TaxID=2921412 RepID=UPI00077A877F|nr:hypothetical protein [Bacillus cereus]KXY12842.1 hypothetical protein AT267_10855 [Bacillus cereus]
MENEIKMHHVIVNGKPALQTIKDYTDKGWIHLGNERADKFHPYALDTDTVMFFAKLIDKEKYDAEMKCFRESHLSDCEG